VSSLGGDTALVSTGSSMSAIDATSVRRYEMKPSTDPLALAGT
jgi:hypothetical protein